MAGATKVSASAPVLDQYFQQFDDDPEAFFDDEPAILGKDYQFQNDAMNGAQLYEEWGRVAAELDRVDALAAEEQMETTGEDYAFQEHNPYFDTMGTGMLGGQPSHHLPFQVNSASCFNVCCDSDLYYAPSLSYKPKRKYNVTRTRLLRGSISA